MQLPENAVVLCMDEKIGIVSLVAMTATTYAVKAPTVKRTRVNQLVEAESSNCGIEEGQIFVR